MINHNLSERLIDRSIDFKASLIPTPFKKMNVEDAMNYTISLIT
jgi:hypothetical protein